MKDQDDWFINMPSFGSNFRNCPNLSFLDVGHCRDLRVWWLGSWKNMMSTQVDPGILLCFFVDGIIVKPNTHTQTYTNYKSPHTHMKPRITFQPTHPKRKWRRTQGSQRTDVADVEVVNWWSRSWHIPFWRRCFPGCGKGAKRWNPLQLHIEKLLIYNIYICHLDYKNKYLWLDTIYMGIL